MGEATAIGSDEAAKAWNTVLFDKFLRFRHVASAGVAAHSEAALARHPPGAGARAIDLGCGFGDTTLRIAGLVGTGTAFGVDFAPRFVEFARAEAAARAVSNVRFEARDVELDPLDGPHDFAFARFGTMFFRDPVAAFRNVRASMAAGGRLCFVVWRRRDDNPWVSAAHQVVARLVPRMDAGGAAAPGGPGPFSMADADSVSTQLQNAGWRQVAFERHDAPICLGRDLDEAVEVALALGPSGEHMRLAGPLAEQRLLEVRAALRDLFSAHLGDGGVTLQSSAWVVTALTH